MSECCKPGDKCGCGCGNQSATSNSRVMVIDLLYLDLEVCDRCKGTEAVLDGAIADVKNVIEAMGIGLTVRKTHVTSEAQALELGFISSPTIRIDGVDVQLDVKESLCESCGDLCGDDVDCRVWVWHGQEYTVPPKGMLVEAIMKEVLNPSSPAASKTMISEVPKNLKDFFVAKQLKDEGSCC